MGEYGEVDPLAAKLSQCRPFLREDYESIDARLPGLHKILQSRGAGECWHKHGTFYEHLLQTYRILKLWGSSDAVALFGLCHSAYSNSYVNLAIFAPDVDRSVLRGLIGDEAEELVHIFCIIPRQELIFDRLLHALTDAELEAGLQQYSSEAVHEKKRLFVPAEGLVVKHIRTGEDVVLPRRLVALFLLLTMADFSDQFYGWQGLVVKHIRTGEDVVLPRRLVALFLLLTMADFSDQLYGWQDVLFSNEDGEFRYAGNEWFAPWPGSCKPGLWLTAVSRMGVLLSILLHEDAAEQHGAPLHGLPERPFGALQVPVPPIFKNCKEILSPANQNRSRDQYWEAMHLEQRERLVNTGVPLLQKCCKLNPHVAEPRLLLAQIHLVEGQYDLAETEATEGLRLLMNWATPWDKRMTWEGWLSFGRILRDNAHQKSWPTTAFGILNLGLVK